MSKSKVKLSSVGGPRAYINYNECEEDDVLVEGTYKGLSKTTSKFGHHSFEFKPAAGGPVVSLNYSGHLAYLIENFIEEGDYCRVIYKGKEVLTKGPYKNKESHQFDIEKAVDGDEEEVEDEEVETEEEETEEEETEEEADEEEELEEEEEVVQTKKSNKTNPKLGGSNGKESSGKETVKKTSKEVVSGSKKVATKSVAASSSKPGKKTVDLSDLD